MRLKLKWAFKNISSPNRILIIGRITYKWVVVPLDHVEGGQCHKLAAAVVEAVVVRHLPQHLVLECAPLVQPGKKAI